MSRFSFFRFLTGGDILYLEDKNEQRQKNSEYFLAECCLVYFYLGTLTEAVLLIDEHD